MKEKIITAIVSISLLFSAIVIEAGATPGVDEWGYPTEVKTENLIYNPESPVNIKINTNGLEDGKRYYLYFPDYHRDGNTYNLTWNPYLSSTGTHKNIQVTTSGTDATLKGIYLDRSGLWVLNPTELTGVINCNDLTNFSNTVSKWFWVNSSTTYTTKVSPDEVYYGKNETITITVRNADGDLTYCWVDIRRALDETEVFSFPKEASYPNGILNVSSSYLTRLTHAGEYSVVTWYDTPPQPLYQTIGYGYNNSFGNSSDFDNIDYYNYTICGPWDPPEYMAENKEITVKVGEPTTSIPVVNRTMYWGFDGEVSISVENYNGGYIDDLNVKVYNGDEDEVTENLAIDNTTVGKGYVYISNKDKVNNSDADNVTGGWGRDKYGNVYGEDGTWYAYLYNDIDDDGIEEWNTTVDFEVDHAPDLQWKWIDDDGCLSDDNNDGVIPWVPDFNNHSLEIAFQIIGEDHSYYPEDSGENITVSGDALFLPAMADELPGVSYSDGTWTIPLIPTMSMGGGEIIFSVEWEGYGKHTEILNVGGSKNNGTVVSISPSSFVIDKDVELMVTVLDSEGTSFMNADVSLYWIKDGTLQGDAINHTAGGGDSKGRYTFMFNTSDQTTGQKLVFDDGIKAPRDIAAYVKLYYGSPMFIYGYATAEMKAKSDLAVDVSKNTVMAGEKTRLWMNISIYSGGVTNKTYPNEGDGLQIELYDEAGEKIDLNEDFGSVRDDDLKDISNPLNDYFLKPGAYTVYTYNNTHDSTGHNATLVVKAVDVTCDKSPFIWKYDKDLTATFTVKYNGNIVDGKIRIYNMTDEGDHYGAWFNTGDKSLTFDVVGGVVTVEGINASNLPEGKARGNITFTFRPEKSGSNFAPADGIVPVKIPDVSATPKAIPYNEPAHLTIKVTGRGNALKGVRVGLEIPGMAEEMESKTDIKGEALFSFMPLTTGDIKIKIENRTSDVTVLITSWLLYIDAPQYVDEGEPFTVKIRDGSADGPGVSGATVIFNGKTQVGDYTFTAPSVKADMQYTIETKKEGYSGDDATILVVNVPQLTIVLETEELTAGEGAKFTVCIADDTGRAIIGATVTFNDKDHTTGAQGIATMSVPTEEGDYTIMVVKEGFASASVSIEVVPGSPGFEMLMLIAALGIAFILLKRRKR